MFRDERSYDPRRVLPCGPLDGDDLRRELEQRHIVALACTAVRAYSGSIIDSDVHNEVPTAQALFPYLPPYWVEHLTNTLFKGPTEPAYPPDAPIAARLASRPVEGGPPGSRLALVQEQVLDAPRAEFGILNCLYGIDSLHNPDAAIALASAVNDWQIAEWLDKDRASARLDRGAESDPALAAREIERVGEPPRLRPGPAARARAAPVRQPSLPPAVGGHRATRPRRRDSLRRCARQSADTLRLAVVLLRGVRGHGAGLRHPDHEHGQRRRVRPVPDVAGQLARSRLHLAARRTCGASTRSGATCAGSCRGSNARRRNTSASTCG